MNVAQHRRGPYRRILISRVHGGWRCAVVLWDNSPDRSFAPSRIFRGADEAVRASRTMRLKTGLPIDESAFTAYLASAAHKREMSRWNSSIEHERP